MRARLKKAYQELIIPELKKKFNYKNLYQAPRLEKIVINVGIAEGKENIKILEMVSNDLALITGQKPQIRRAKKSIAAFKLRKGAPIGLKVTLRRERMYEFLDRLINAALPRIRDFRGVSPKAFDQEGNYNLGIVEHHIFPELNLSKAAPPRGMNISFVIKGNNIEENKELLKLFGMPFREE